MIKSMTGFGKANCEFGGKQITIEIRSLNSKQLDSNIRIPVLYKDKETEIRNLFSSRIERGKVELFVALENNTDINNVSINTSFVKKYYIRLKELSEELGIIDQTDLLSLVFKMPDAMITDIEVLEEPEWQTVKAAISAALDQVDEFRISEGLIIEKEFTNRIEKIKRYNLEIKKFESERIHLVKERIKKDMKELEATVNIDENRFEQELFFYIEKMDITEEKVRLMKHCDYFLESMNVKEANGKKLNFISQEIGREINTLGSKAMNADIQRIVVQMKDELEKIKEQLGNVL